MIKAVFYKNKNSFNGFEISGHSGYAKRGEDIVCASVSVVSLHTARILNEECSVIDILQQDEEGRLSVKLNGTDDLTVMLIKNLIKTLREIQDEYSGYLSVE